MKILSDHFSADYSLMNLAVISSMLGMGAWFIVFFIRHVNEDTKNAGI